MRGNHASIFIEYTFYGMPEVTIENGVQHTGTTTYLTLKLIYHPIAYPIVTECAVNIMGI